MKRLLVAILLLLASGAGWVAYRLKDHPSLEPFVDYVLAAGELEPGAVRVTFLGVSTVLISDGETALLTDGFFSRPSLTWPLLPLPAFFDDVGASMRFLAEQAQARPDLELSLLPFGEPVAIFEPRTASVVSAAPGT